MSTQLVPVVRRVSGNNWHPHRQAWEVICYAKVDSVYGNQILKFRWCLHSNGYVIASVDKNKRKMLLHHMVWLLSGNLLPKPPETLDHRNRDKLDCTLGNLRVASKRLQQINKGIQRNNKTGHRGVSWCKRTKKFRAYSKFLGRYKSLGYYDTELQAAEAVTLYHKSLNLVN